MVGRASPLTPTLSRRERETEARPFELGLLEQRDVDEVEEETGGPLGMCSRQQHQRLAKQHEHHARNHRIADVAVRTSQHEPSRGIPRGERPAPSVPNRRSEAAKNVRPTTSRPRPASCRTHAGPLPPSEGSTPYRRAIEELARRR